MRSSIIGGVWLGLVCSLALAAPQPIRIGVPGAFTGGSAPMGLSMRNGIRLAAAEINKSGGVLGRPIELVERDDGGIPARGIKVAQQLLTQDRVVAVVGFVNTGVALAASKNYQDARVPVMLAVATAAILTRQFPLHGNTDNYIFRVAAADDLQAPLIVREAVQRSGYRKLAIFADNTNYGYQGLMELERALGQNGLKPSYVARFNLQERDMANALLQARNAGSQAILTYAIGPELAELANTMSRMDWKVPIIGSWTLSMSNFIDNAGPNGEGARMVQSYIPAEDDTPRRRDFLDGYQWLFHTRRIPSPPSAAQGYDGMKLMAEAIRQAGSLDGVAIVRALENLRQPVAGVITTYKQPFSRNDHEALELNVPVIGKVERGRVVYAYPADKPRQ
ncbi:branched-chain amino acid ABC transporter, amino acid-binding protein [Aquitalea magnusonii]|uniref:Branched-chain amino acid ABC transporter, amino acid-binding protein n=1 Tax=Aquitalea magnusonii TaxID=332411 RepID=A0A3G9GFS7_9NEIS|nr:ABC transporter substrate-binding protein [Aquitalea magnusonii]BBF86224.1 branched-chain amino acid ABC transporter, amino acid-binding protein [Aquitalea magnusonii]